MKNSAFAVIMVAIASANSVAMAAVVATCQVGSGTSNTIKVTREHQIADRSGFTWARTKPSSSCPPMAGMKTEANHTWLIIT
jgi:hypothetical protein